MAKPVLTVLLFAMVALAQTVVATTTHSCDMEMNHMLHLEHMGTAVTQCRHYIKLKMGKLISDNQGKGTVQDCCTVLRRVSAPCVCEAIRKMVMQKQKGMGMAGMGMNYMLRFIPKSCGSTTHCGAPV